MRITKISVRELFGIPTFNYDIELKINKHITIVHGPNGSGKTVLFKMIDGLFNKHYLVFWKYPFREFVVSFDNEETVVVRREYDSKGKKYLQPEIFHPKTQSQPFKLEIDHSILRYISPSFRGQISPEYEDIARLIANQELFSPEGSGFADELFLRYGEGIFTRNMREPKWLKALQDKIKINLINTNRLSINKVDTNQGRKPTSIKVTAITENSRDLASRIQEKILEADSQSKTLDRTFPNRVVTSVINSKERQTLPYAKIREKLDELEKERKRLAESGLLDGTLQETEFQIPGTIVNIQQEGTLRSVLTMYINDTQKKLKVYQTLLNKIELFKEITQSMLRHKKIHISKNGFQLQGDTGQTIPLEELSSGEQHLLVLVYNLLFRKEEKADELILIDEPELSLHISWQKRFIEDLARINELSEFDVIIATHSPSIINGRLDLMVGIQGATGEEDN